MENALFSLLLGERCSAPSTLLPPYMVRVLPGNHPVSTPLNPQSPPLPRSREKGRAFFAHLKNSSSSFPPKPNHRRQPASLSTAPSHKPIPPFTMDLSTTTYKYQDLSKSPSNNPDLVDFGLRKIDACLVPNLLPPEDSLSRNSRRIKVLKDTIIFKRVVVFLERHVAAQIPIPHANLTNSLRALFDGEPEGTRGTRSMNQLIQIDDVDIESHRVLFAPEAEVFVEAVVASTEVVDGGVIDNPHGAVWTEVDLGAIVLVPPDVGISVAGIKPTGFVPWDADGSWDADGNMHAWPADDNGIASRLGHDGSLIGTLSEVFGGLKGVREVLTVSF